MATERRKSNGIYIFHNENPRGLLRASDCVVRAIAKATEQTWEIVLMALTEMALEVKSIPNTDTTYIKYLESLGYPMRRQLRKSDNTKYTVEEFASKYSEGTYILSLTKHMTVIENGEIYDTWNCSDRAVGNYWKIG